MMRGLGDQRIFMTFSDSVVVSRNDDCWLI